MCLTFRDGKHCMTWQAFLGHLVAQPKWQRPKRQGEDTGRVSAWKNKDVVTAADRRRMVHSAWKLGKTTAIQHLEPVLGSVAPQNSKMEKALECRQKGRGKNGACWETIGRKAKDGRTQV